MTERRRERKRRFSVCALFDTERVMYYNRNVKTAEAEKRCAMGFTQQDVSEFVRENDVRFIRLAFCDLFGELKNISILPDQLEKAFKYGIAFDASAVRGFLGVDRSDLFLRPDPSTMSVVPWRSMGGVVIRMICDIYYPDGKPFEGSGRYVLDRIKRRAAGMGYSCNIGAECEFYLFREEEGKMVPLDDGGYFDVFPKDRGENVRREICVTLEQMGLRPERSHHEHGPGQNEVDFRYDGVMETADNIVTFRWVVASVARNNGLTASFEPKPVPGESGNGLHVNISLIKDGVNIFDGDGAMRRDARSFIAGILNRISEICAFTNPKEASYARLGAFEAPRFATWSRGNRSQLVRVPYAYGDSKRIEVRNPDCVVNPYLVFALLLNAGLEGIENGEELPDECDENAYLAQEGKYPMLPATLSEAKALAAKSAFVAETLGKKAAESFLEG